MKNFFLMLGRVAIVTAVVTLLLAWLTSGHASSNPTFWSDSYDAGDGICRCDSSYDHGINNTTVQTPCGDKKVPEVCDLIMEKYGAGPTGNRTYYNTVQCGWPPLNNVADETDCPGIPANTSGTWSGPRCNEKGSRWPLDGICDDGLDCGSSSWGGALAFCAVDLEQANQWWQDILLWMFLFLIGAIATGFAFIMGRI